MENNAISLFELNRTVKEVLHAALPEKVWIRAETSDVRQNQNGHCYLEFIEKDKSGKTMLAKARGMIWSTTFHLLKAYFESTTGQAFASGLKVLVEVSVEYHEVFGLSLTVHDIDPAYTLGDQALNRAAILRQLEEDGVLDLNKELELPLLTNRIAVISSPTAAGYEDFCNQLENNSQGFVFYIRLFPAIMQGDRTENSIISALEQVYEHQEKFDAVVIIRGGGATSELSAFDSYLLAASVAQFPLPVITGIGHERDETVLDIVAHTRAKTPTAVAEFLVGYMADTAGDLDMAQQLLTEIVQDRMQDEKDRLKQAESDFVYMSRNWYKDQSTFLASLGTTLKKEIQAYRKGSDALLATIAASLVRNTQQLSKEEQKRLSSYHAVLEKNALGSLVAKEKQLELYDKILELVSPQNILKKGYTLTMADGKLVKSAALLGEGQELTTQFADGKVKSIIKKKV
ncbi:exodeoxyribonuclease VII large subunit [Dysgonomonas sp. 25]|uniref:exodeoxyribonuclease VII large subunit n=1 Tax=Dysgonomonas sp. 25 TaxID=2302933 RepID=UPI0013D142F7|nr:exodeoxyribonuclease VII large subunit [Dysgonomonas sp. 25]NDV68048.1 exodeoxyribonuclease VII large subunit [Dysgonomonas sp. 25]